MENYRVRCGRHHYDTLFTLSKGTAISAARMHAMLHCNDVQVTDRQGNIIKIDTDETSDSDDRQTVRLHD